MIRMGLVIAATVLALAGLCATVTANWDVAAAAWNLAFLCKWGECWLLEHVPGGGTQ